MNIRIGDKVRFISEKLEGKVTGLIDNNTVNVYCNDYGFEIPASIGNLVVISSELGVSKSTESTTATKNIIVESANTLYLAIEPDNFKNLTDSIYAFHLINDTDLMCLYAVSKNDGRYTTGIAAGNCAAGESVHLEQFKLREIDKIKEITVHAIFFNKSAHDLRMPIVYSYKINATSFCKSGNYKHTRWFDAMVMLRALDKEEIQAKTSNDTSENSLKELAKVLKEKQHIDAPTTSKEDTAPNKNVIEIDLHTDSLLETTAGMNNSDILDYQLNIFRDVMEKYKMRKGQKIVLIHGKGDGVLRQRILWELQTKYKRYQHQDASFKQYGFGATLVTIK